MRVHHSLVAAVAAALLPVVSSFAATPVSGGKEVAQFAGSYKVDLATNTHTSDLSPGASLVYQMATAAAGYSWVKATSGNRIIGDYITPAAGGTLSDFTCTLYNPTTGGNTGNIDAGTLTVGFHNFDPNTGLITSTIGGFSGTFDFTGDPLLAGYYTTLSYTGIESLAINLPSTDYLVTTQFDTTGNSLRQGVIFGGAAAIGSSAYDAATGDWYGSGSDMTAGSYYFSSGNINNLYLEVGVVPEPVSMGILASALPLLARRRKA